MPSLSLYEVLRPPASSCSSTPASIRLRISDNAVSCEHFVILAHFVVVSLPSNLLSNIFNIFFCLLLIDIFRSPKTRQKDSVLIAPSVSASAFSRDRSKHPRNHTSHFVISVDPFCVSSSTQIGRASCRERL